MSRVVPFGTKSSLFILDAVMMHHLKKSTSEIAADMLKSVFVYNIITGCESRSAALNYYTKANHIMDQAHLPLQAWGFNNSVVETSLAQGTFPNGPITSIKNSWFDLESGEGYVKRATASSLNG
jgi:hypothetical protein